MAVPGGTVVEIAPVVVVVEGKPVVEENAHISSVLNKKNMKCSLARMFLPPANEVAAR